VIRPPIKANAANAIPAAIRQLNHYEAVMLQVMTTNVADAAFAELVALPMPIEVVADVGGSV
jgi:hypothetical protein